MERGLHRDIKFALWLSFFPGKDLSAEAALREFELSPVLPHIER